MVTPSTAHNRDLGRTGLLRLALNPTKWFLNSGRQRFSSQELPEVLDDGRRYDYHRMLSRFLRIIPNRHVIPLIKTNLMALKIELVQRKQLAYELSKSR